MKFNGNYYLQARKGWLGMKYYACEEHAYDFDNIVKKFYPFMRPIFRDETGKISGMRFSSLLEALMYIKQLDSTDKDRLNIEYVNFKLK